MTCIVGACEQPGTVPMRLESLGQVREATFCEKCARVFEGCWQRLDQEPAGEQLELELA